MNIPINSNIGTNVQKVHPNQEAKSVSQKLEEAEPEVLGASLFQHHLQKVQQSLRKLQLKSEEHQAQNVSETNATKQKSLTLSPTRMTIDSLRASNISKFPSDPKKSFHLTTLTLFTIKQAHHNIREHLKDLVRLHALQTYRANM